MRAASLDDASEGKLIDIYPVLEITWNILVSEGSDSDLF